MNFAIVEQIALYIPLILGAYISFGLLKVPNLSIEMSYVFGAVVASRMLMLQGHSGIVVLLVALLLSFCAGGVVGTIVALFCEYAAFSYILSSIITMGLFYGISQWVIGGSHVTISQYYNPLKMIDMISSYPELPIILIISTAIFILMYYFLKTHLGVSCALYGDNPLFLKNYRINQSYVVIAGMAISNGLAGISGYMVAASNGFVDTTMGVGLPLMCISALIVGRSLQFSARVIALIVPLVGLIGYFVIQIFLLKIGFDLRYFMSVQAILVALLLIVSSHFIRKSSENNLLGI